MTTYRNSEGGVVLILKMENEAACDTILNPGSQALVTQALSDKILQTWKYHVTSRLTRLIHVEDKKALQSWRYIINCSNIIGQVQRGYNDKTRQCN